MHTLAVFGHDSLCVLRRKVLLLLGVRLSVLPNVLAQLFNWLHVPQYAHSNPFHTSKYRAQAATLYTRLTKTITERQRGGAEEQQKERQRGHRLHTSFNVRFSVSVVYATWYLLKY